MDSVCAEPSIANQGEAFLETWYENLQSFPLTHMSQLITFSDQTISKVNEEIEKTKAELRAKFDRNECKEIISTLERLMNLTENTYNKEKQRNVII